MPRLWLRTGSRTAFDTREPSCRSVRSVSGRHQDRARRHGYATVAQGEQDAERHAAARGNAAQYDVIGGDADVEQLQVGANTIFVPGGKRMLGSQPVEHEPRAGVRHRAKAGQHRALHVRQACHVRAAREVQDDALGPGAPGTDPLRVAVRQRVVAGDLEPRRMLGEQPLDRAHLPRSFSTETSRCRSCLIVRRLSRLAVVVCQLTICPAYGSRSSARIFAAL